MKKCKACNKEKEESEFYTQLMRPKNKPEYLYHRLECKECTKMRSAKWINDNKERYHEIDKNRNKKSERIQMTKLFKRTYREKGGQLNWQRNNTEKTRVYNSNRRAYHALLPYSLTDEQFNLLIEEHHDSCFLTGSTNHHLEHFIPIAWGHGGNYIGNLYFLDETLNLTKKDINPFEWIKKDEIRNQIDLAKWNKLVHYLASENKMNVDEYEEYVYWCENNKRSIEELEIDNTPSITLWSNTMMSNLQEEFIYLST